MSFASTDILFEKFEIIECLKKDSCSTVYLANHIFMGKQIILKTLNLEDINDSVSLDRFKREAKILAKVEDPNLIRVTDSGIYEKFFYISFEYFESTDLRTAMRERNFTVEQKRNIAIQLLKGLDAANRKGIIHRDIKPENLLLNNENLLKIADFGLALNQNELVVTSKSSIVGTPAYMSPEQIRGENLSCQTDLFSAGIVIFELFRGHNPFLGKDINETINNILDFREETIQNDLQELPSDIKELLKDLLKVNTKERAKSAGEVLFITKLLTTSEYDSLLKSDKRNYHLIPISAAVLLLLAGFLFLSNVFKAERPLKSETAIEPIKQSAAAKVSKEDILKPDNKTPKNIITAESKIEINVFPWAEINIDNNIFDKTPLRNEITLKPGKHSIIFVHPDYPEYKKYFFVEPGKNMKLNINFEKITGKLDCNVIPWGDLYVNNRKVGTTPLVKPLNLLPGDYRLKVINGVLKEEKEVRINIKAGQLSQYNINLNNGND